jgi:hypothetical protein
VRTEGDAARVVLDVSKSGWIRGRVEVPDGRDARGVRVLAEGLEGFSSRQGRILGETAPPDCAFTTCREDGEFWLRVPGDREVTLRAEATGLQPAADGGRLKVKTPRDGVVLRLVEGRIARLRMAESLRKQRVVGQPLNRTVRLYRGEAVGKAVQTLRGDVDAEGRVISFSGYEPGTWTIWVDAGPFAPVILEDVVLTDGETDLGEAAAHYGSTIVVDIVLPKDQDMPRMYAWAMREGEPTYSRRVDAQSDAVLRIRGLGPGRFRVSAGSHMGGGLRLDQTVEVDGREEVRLTLDATR